MSDEAPDEQLKELNRYKDSACVAAREAGELILEALAGGANKKAEVKNGVDLVTEVDRQAEKLIIQRLQADSPGVSVVGEESAGSAALSEQDTYFLVDPLDGTTNFVSGYPFVCVSIALVMKRKPVVGVVYNPILDEMYTACSGGGAFLNGSCIAVRAAAGLGDALVLSNVGAARDEKFIKRTLGVLAELLRRDVRALRMCGSAAQSMCHVAAGKADCYFEDGFGGPWDVAAGAVIVEEAGGLVKGIHGESFRLMAGKGAVVCGHSDVVREVCDGIKASHAGETGGSKAPVSGVAAWGPFLGLVQAATLLGVAFLLDAGLQKMNVGRR